jgi:hypothetical protein
MNKIVHYIGLDVHKESIALSSNGRKLRGSYVKARMEAGLETPNCTASVC